MDKNEILEKSRNVTANTARLLLKRYFSVQFVIF